MINRRHDPLDYRSLNMGRFHTPGFTSLTRIFHRAYLRILRVKSLLISHSGHIPFPFPSSFIDSKFSSVSHNLEMAFCVIIKAVCQAKEAVSGRPYLTIRTF